MVILYILFLSTLPICLAQFSIQGPSDGNRAAQSLKYSEEKGIEYSDQRDSLGTGDFSIQGATHGNSDFQIQGASDGNANFQIQGATDGNSNFQIQGATDGNSDFKIQGATDGNANFNIQGATDENHQSPIHSPYDANQGGQRSLQYNNPNGFKLNWRSYAHGQLSSRPQEQPDTQSQSAYTQNQEAERYEQEPAPRPVSRLAPRPVAPQQTHQSVSRTPSLQQQQPINYRPFDNAPAQIKDLLQFQLQIPYLNAIPEHFRPENLAAAYQQSQIQNNQSPQDSPPPPPPPQRTTPRQKSRGHQRSKRQTHAQQQPQPQQQYRRIPQPAPEKHPQYSTNVPSQIQQLLQFQSQTPYLSVIPEQFRHNFASISPPNQHQYTQQGDKHRRRKRQAQHSQRNQQHQSLEQQYKRIPQPVPEAQPQYSANIPPQIKQLLEFQSQTPYLNAIPEQFRFNLENVQQQAPQHGARQRQRRQAQGHLQQQYKRIAQPAPEVQPQYSTNLPSEIQKILNFQAQTPYDIFPNQVTYKVEKPYIPQTVSSPIPQYNAGSGYQGENHREVKPVNENQ